jgi:hypothetical protein
VHIYYIHCVIGPLALETRGGGGGLRHVVCTALHCSAKPTGEGGGNFCCEMVSLKTCRWSGIGVVSE